jgi:hypothetical protein
VAAAWTGASIATALPEAVAVGGLGAFALSGVGLIAFVALLVAISPFIVPTYRFLRAK